MSFPTPEQEQILTSTSRRLFVKACPGAGKTRVIAELFLRQVVSLPSCRGLALLSFTNAAADEIRAACAGSDPVAGTGYPSFVGTLDSFIARFLVLPFEESRSGERLQIVESWDKWGFQRVHLVGGNSKWGLSLDWIVLRDGGPEIDLERISPPAARQEVEDSCGAYRERAATELRSLNEGGYINCAGARRLALQRIRDPVEGGILGRALTARFAQILLDEAQDCNEEDLEIIDWLSRMGIPTVVMCDPDQAIFEFRTDYSPAKLQETVVQYDKLGLTGNFRSSPAICRVAATLRASRPQPDCPLGPNRREESPVHILPYSGRPSSQIAVAFLQELDEHGCALPRSRILAHKLKVAADSAGATLSGGESSSTSFQLALAVAAYRAEGLTGAGRLEAVRRAERVILQRLVAKGELGGRNPAHTARAQGISEQWLRSMAHSFLARLPVPEEGADPRSWVADARVLLGSLPAPLGSQWVYSAKQVLKPTKYLPVSEKSALGVPYGTIHKAKGKQFEAVAFVIPPDGTSPTQELIDNWRQGRLHAHEPTRVAYVAVTRAERLLVIAIPRDFFVQLTAMLCAKEAPFVTIDAGSSSGRREERLPL